MRLLLHRFTFGAVAGGAFLVALLVLDIGGLRTLLLDDRESFVPFFMLLVDLCGLFGIVVMISSLAEEEPTRPKGRARVVAALPRPARHLLRISNFAASARPATRRPRWPNR
ncbi:MAG TPA: hypothetical protein VHA35_00660 [Dongiaceae bacterium]|jgi:hypothetical protein|nr:hypothetical protein [Dongiaceae bacterium]